MEYNTIRKCSYVYISLPLLIFSITWLNSFSVLFFTFCILGALYFTIKEKISINSVTISKKVFYLILLISFLWVFFSGIGGWWYQSDDFSARNAIFRDLINYSWPVYYPSQNTTLNYYLGFWLVPALITKLCFYLCDANNYYFVGMQILMIWTIFGVVLFLCLVVYASHPQNRYQLFFSIILPLLFSGLDIVGSYYLGYFHSDHLERWTKVQYSSLTTLLFWVFNQTIISWIATLLMFIEKRINNFGIIFVLSFFCGPLPTVGIAVFMIVYVLINFYRNYTANMLNKFWKSTFSISNILSLPLLVLIYCFFNTNTATTNYPLHLSPLPVMDYVHFCLIEFLCYVFVIFKYYKKDIIFWTIICSLCSVCLFSLGGYGDFQMRVSIPAILLLMIYVLNHINSAKTIAYRELILFIFITVGTFTPFYEIRRGFVHFIDTGGIFHLTDEFVTLENKNINKWPFFNYLTKYSQEKVFYKYFSKEFQ